MSYGTVIIGNGISGITTARYLRKNSDQRIQVISSETPYFFSRTALMYVYMGHMKAEQLKPYEDGFWEKNRIELVQARVENVNAEERFLKLDTGELIRFDNLVIATGSRPRFFNWKGQGLKGVQGMFSWQDLELLESYTPGHGEKNHPVKKAIITGAGLIGVELAEMLKTRGIEVTFLVKDSYFWGNVITENEGRLINRHIQDHGVELLLNTELDEIFGDKEGKVRGVKTNHGEEIDCQLVGITTGVQPNIEFLKDSGIEINRGILVDDKLQTNIPGIYAAGDCAEIRNVRKGRRSLEPVWYVGRMMGEVLGSILAGKPQEYKPGPWFNSAKFFDIEYQTYGTVNPRKLEDEQQFFWKMKGENRFMTIAYKSGSHKFTGVNSYGIRLRHEFFDKVLREEWEVGKLVGHLSKANFDPEFSRSWVKDVQSEFSNQTGIELTRPGIFSKLKG